MDLDPIHNRRWHYQKHPSLYDTGYTVFGIYSEGVLTEEFYTDTLETFGFNNRNIEYDALGQITYIGSVFPGDYRLLEYFENGVQTMRLEEDGFFGDGVEPWKYIATDFDNNGIMDRRETEYDNGTKKTDYFANGVKEATWQTDTDNAKSWSEIETEYDQNGVITRKLVTNDNATITDTTYVDGVRDLQYKLDVEDVFQWEDSLTVYNEDGTIDRRETRYDNDDAVIMLYEAGAVATRLDIDSNGDKSWLLEVTEYGDDGRSVSKFNTVEDIPEEYLPLYEIGIYEGY